MHPQTVPINPLPEAAPEMIEDRDALQHLHDRITDALEGFRVMESKAEASFRPVVARFVALHETHAAAVAEMLASRGAADDLDGTLMGTVNRAVVSVRSMLTGIDAESLDAIRSGEENVLSAFDRAIGGVALPEESNALAAMRDDLVALLDQARDLA